MISEPVAGRLQRSHGDLGTIDLANLQETNDTVSSEEDGQESGDDENPREVNENIST